MAKRLGWAAFGLSVAMLVLPPLLGQIHSNVETGPFIVQMGTGLAFLTIVFVGALTASRQPANRMWWIFCLFGTATLASFATDSLTRSALDAGTHSILIRLGAAMSNLMGGPVVIMFMIFLLLLFPDGRPASRRWLRVTTFAACWCTLFALAELFAPGRLNNITTNRPVINPLGVAALLPVRSIVWGPAFLMLPILAIAGALSLVFRFRAAARLQRQQIKLFAFAGAIVAMTFVAGPVYLWRPNSAPTWGWNVAFMLAVLSIPCAVGAAILRYRLYDIDRLISRTASYFLMSAMLAGLFAGFVLIPTAVTGARGTTPSWIIAIATLAVAVLFQPLRRRVQNTVDRRFNRARYNAARTIDAFSARLRDEIDLESLQEEMRAVVVRTMQPASVSVWLRGGAV